MICFPAPVLLWAVAASRMERVPLEYAALSELLRRETGTPARHITSRHTTLRNPRSTAYGLGQFLDSTWAGTGIAKTHNPVDQLRAVYRYLHKRYGGARQGLEFHREHGYYE